MKMAKKTMEFEDFTILRNCEQNFVIFHSRKQKFFPTRSGYLARLHGMNLFFKTLNKLISLTNLEYPILSAKHVHILHSIYLCSSLTSIRRGSYLKR